MASATPRTHHAREIVDNFEKYQDAMVVVAGRIMTKELMARPVSPLAGFNGANPDLRSLG